MAAILYYLEYGRPLRASTAAAAVVVVRTRPRAIPLAVITMRKSTHAWVSFSFLYGYEAPLGGPWGGQSSAINSYITWSILVGINLAHAKYFY